MSAGMIGAGILSSFRHAERKRQSRPPRSRQLSSQQKQQTYNCKGCYAVFNDSPRPRRHVAWGSHVRFDRCQIDRDRFIARGGNYDFEPESPMDTSPDVLNRDNPDKVA